MGTPLFPQVAGLVLDGGHASRFDGAHKAFLEVGGRPIAERTVELFRELFGELLVATRQPEPWLSFDVRLVDDPVENAGPLGGIAGGLLATDRGWLVAVAGDMPFLNRALLQHLVERALEGPERVIVPLRRGQVEPLHAVHPQAYAERAAELVRGGTRRVTDYFAEVDAEEIEVSTLGIEGATDSFININRGEEWLAVRDVKVDEEGSCA
ncbi:MAG: molybdenum cofactor guanylyltransferase [Acidobacteriota bacterium]